MNYRDQIEWSTQAPRLFVEPRCQTMMWIGIGGLALAGTSAGLAASGAGQPQQPNIAASSKELSNVQAELLPLQRGFESAAQSGGDFTFSLPAGVKPQDYGFNTASSQTGYFLHTGGTFVSAGKPADFAAHPHKYDFIQAPAAGDTAPIKQNADGSYTVSFKGMGTADVQSAIAKQEAATKLALSQKYDSQFIDQSLAEEKLADPQSFAARDEMSKLIQDQIARPVNSPVSDMLNSQVQDTLNAAKTNSLTDMDKSRLDAAVAAAQGDRGGTGGGSTDFSRPLTTGFAGEKRQADAAQGAQAFLGSGSSPEDIAYRREQQNLANLSAEVNGKTPQSQFASISGAQTGPTPTTTAAPLALLPNSGNSAASIAIQNQRTAQSVANGQANPWMVGLSTLVNAGSVAGGAGWRPFAA